MAKKKKAVRGKSASAKKSDKPLSENEKSLVRASRYLAEALQAAMLLLDDIEFRLKRLEADRKSE